MPSSSSIARPHRRDRTGTRRTRDGEVVHVELRTEVGIPHDRARQHFSPRALEDKLTEVEHVDVLADLAHQCHVVLDQEDTDATLGDRAPKDLPEAPRLAAVEPRRWFVEQ